MKDAYSFDLDYEGAKAAYNRMFVAYLRTFARMGLKAIPMRADTGPIGGDLSHEFIILADTGESEVFCHRDFLELDGARRGHRFRRRRRDRRHRQALDDALRRDRRDARRGGLGARSPKRDRLSARGIEVGHIFYFGDEIFRADGRQVHRPGRQGSFVSMGSYGIGVSRLVAAIIEASHDETGIIWPDSVAPFDVGADQPEGRRRRLRRVCEELYAALDSGRHGRALRRQRRAAGAQVRDRRPDRPALAADRRPARRRGRRGRAQEPRAPASAQTLPVAEVAAPARRSRMSEAARRQPRPRPAPGRSRPSSGWSPGAICARAARRRSSR